VKKRKKKDGRGHPFLLKDFRRGYFLVFFAVFGAAFFAVPHGPFDLQAIVILLFENSHFKITQQIWTVNKIDALCQLRIKSELFL
jgi:hypothetical protein